jgi:hypothetical protein
MPTKLRRTVLASQAVRVSTPLGTPRMSRTHEKGDERLTDWVTANVAFVRPRSPSTPERIREKLGIDASKAKEVSVSRYDLARSASAVARAAVLGEVGHPSPAALAHHAQCEPARLLTSSRKPTFRLVASRQRSGLTSPRGWPQPHAVTARPRPGSGSPHPLRSGVGALFAVNRGPGSGGETSR